MNRNKLRAAGDYYIEFVPYPVPGETYPTRRMEIVIRDDTITFRDVDFVRNIVLRESSIPVAVIFDIWPLMQVLLQQVEAKQK